MPSQEPQATQEQPPAADSSDSQGLRPGGVTPEVEQALAKLPEGDRAKVVEDMRQRNADYTKRLQALHGHVRKANALDQLQTIPDFREFIESAQSGSLAGFYRRKSESAPAPGTTEGKEQRAELGNGSTPKTDQGMSNDPVTSQFQQELAQTREELAKVQRQLSDSASQAEVDGFTAANPDWRKWYPHIEAVKGEPGLESLSLQDALAVAKARVDRQPVNDGEVEGKPAAQPAVQAVPEMGDSQPPVPHGAVGVQDGFKQAGNIYEAAQVAKQALGYGLGDVQQAPPPGMNFQGG